MFILDVLFGKGGVMEDDNGKARLLKVSRIGEEPRGRQDFKAEPPELEASCAGPSFHPIFPPDRRVEYFSATNGKWILGAATPRLEQTDPPVIQYDVTTRNRHVRPNVDPAEVRDEFKPFEEVDLFVNRDGGEWTPATMDETQSTCATRIGYRVNWEGHGLLGQTPADRLRRRFVPDEKVHVYRGVLEGWAAGRVRGRRAEQCAGEQQRIRAEQLAGSFASAPTHPDGGDAPTPFVTPRTSAGAAGDAGDAVKMRWWYWVEVEVDACSAREAAASPNRAGAPRDVSDAGRNVRWYPTFLLRRGDREIERDFIFDARDTVVSL